MSSGDFVTRALTAASSTPSIHSDTTQAALGTSGYSGAAFTISGTFVGTINFWATADGGSNWFPCNVTKSDGTATVTTATAPGLFLANISGFTHVSVQLAALTSGSPTVSIHCSALPASGVGAGASGGGGGGGPTLTLTTTGTTGASTYNSSTGALNVPNYADISHIAFTTAGTTGQATYNTSTGALNIPNYADISHLTISNTGTSGAATLTSGNLNVPIYASGALNQVSVTTAVDVTTTLNTSRSTGFGIAFQALYQASALIVYNCTVNNTLSVISSAVQVYRTTGTIPSYNASPGGTDVVVAATRQYSSTPAGSAYTCVGSIYDTTITIGVPYNYYFAFSTLGGTFTMSAGSILQVTETK